MDEKTSSKSGINYRLLIGGLAAGLALLVLAVTYFSLPPKEFPEDKIVSIKEGMAVSEAARTLEQANLIKSQIAFRVYVALSSDTRRIQSGDYLFNSPESSLRIAYRLTKGLLGLPKIKITIFEGMTTSDIAEILGKSILGFDTKRFLTLAKSEEGYLFPDTYFFTTNTKPADAIKLMKETFDLKIKAILPEMESFGKSIPEIITMASIIEKEAMNSTDRRVIAGILWKRIDIGMPLQVDPPFYYILGKDSGKLTLDDLAVDSPYNLYKHGGLTPTPISNPGLDTIIDTINPTSSNYLFYLSDKNGVMHYAANHEGHVANKVKYLQ